MTFQIKPGRCPLCNYDVDGSASIDPDPKNVRAPQEGDFTLCLRCGEILRYGKMDKTGTEFVPAVGFEIFDDLSPAKRARLLDGQRIIKHHQFIQRLERRS